MFLEVTLVRCPHWLQGTELCNPGGPFQSNASIFLWSLFFSDWEPEAGRGVMTWSRCGNRLLVKGKDLWGSHSWEAPFAFINVLFHHKKKQTQSFMPSPLDKRLIILSNSQHLLPSFLSWWSQAVSACPNRISHLESYFGPDCISLMVSQAVHSLAFSLSPETRIKQPSCCIWCSVSCQVRGMCLSSSPYQKCHCPSTLTCSLLTHL